MKRFFSLLAIILLTFRPGIADEGMWLLPLIQQLNMNKMKEMGLRLNAEDIYSVNHSSLKDAVVIFGSGCTGEIVSQQGLLLTNHHCGFESVQSHSSVDHDYLTNGFWAKTKAEEMPTPDLTVTFLVSIVDVTNKINAALKPGLDESDRKDIIKKVSEEIQNNAVKGTHYSAEVDDFFGGNNFYLVVYEKFLDVRFVGAPPSSIGNFGKDADNWTWPRHTGDFSVFRVYCAPDGSPAPYSKNNVPLTPKHVFPISLKGVEKNDFTMIMGYPGSTNRYMTSFEVKDLLENENPNRIKIRGLRQQILMDDMNANPQVRIQYASKYQQSSNYWKYSIGQDRGINNLDVIRTKQAFEHQFEQWVAQNPGRTKEYGRTLKMIEDAMIQNKDYKNVMQYLEESLLTSAEAIGFSFNFFDLYATLKNEKDSSQKISKMISDTREAADNFFKNYNASTDKKVTAAMLKVFYDNISPAFRPDFFTSIEKKYKKNFGKFTENLFKKSMFVDKTKITAFLNKPNIKEIEKDPVMRIALSIYQKYYECYMFSKSFRDSLSKAQRLYIKGISEMEKDKPLYPDANFTMRLTYGSVGDYYPRDAVHYDYYTTLEGVMEKEDSTSQDFIVPKKLKELYKNKDYGEYGQNGIMRVDFTTNNDITGGNSGSPVLNRNGELVGLAFDGNWEAMSGDIVYETALQKCICVDIRYVLFIMDKFAGAKYLVDEMNLIR